MPVEIDSNALPAGARIIGEFSGRGFDPDKAGGPIEKLDWTKLRIHDAGVSREEEHLSRFGVRDKANEIMIERLRKIARGEIEPTAWDRRFYAHELREQERYTKMGWPQGEPEGRQARVLWNNCHTATLEDYGIKDADLELYHPDARRYIARREP